MRVALDTDTGAVIAPEAVPAYSRHPANFGRVVTLVPLLTFTAVGGLPTPGAAIDPTQGSRSGLAGLTPGGGPPLASGADRTQRKELN